jgi:hypothetical protein
MDRLQLAHVPRFCQIVDLAKEDSQRVAVGFVVKRGQRRTQWLALEKRTPQENYSQTLKLAYLRVDGGRYRGFLMMPSRTVWRHGRFALQALPVLLTMPLLLLQDSGAAHCRS